MTCSRARSSPWRSPAIPLPKDQIDDLVPVEREGSVDEDLLEDSARRIEDYLRQQGYWKAEVNPPARRESTGS